MSGATKRRKRASIESGTLSPNPWDLTPLGRNVWCTVEGTRTEDRAPQGCDPSAGSSAGMARGGFDAEAAPKIQTRHRRILACCGRKMVLTMGSTLGTRTEDRAPQGSDPSAGSIAGMARGGFDAEAAPKIQTRHRRILACCGRKMVLTMGSTLNYPHAELFAQVLATLEAGRFAT